MFFLFERSLAEQELSLKFNNTLHNFDIRIKMIPQAKILKIAKIYFQNVAGGGERDPKVVESLAQHFTQ